MAADIETVKLQLAMAFGQGAGVMLADAEAVTTLLAEEGDIIKNAIGNWDKSRWAFVELVRILGHLSAANAAADGSAVIKWKHIGPRIPAVLDICPCLEVGARPQRTNPAR